ncbi:E3 ubiquitin-protein ligase XBAT32-like [Magnolia sinica]|uniref:E3 ubiquitin-protein ligase XBAT32-like n=1 Tax=Magnolia sinica TaxID=86752 RepID=UPI00265B3DD4|nr:E3 ubiquitin-protein ligase XBAT32-like [Magnolia sinica]
MEFLTMMDDSFGCFVSGEFLVSAVRNRDLQEAKALLEYNPCLARYSTLGIRNSPLHYSAAQGHYEIVSQLVEAGVDVNLRNYHGKGPARQILTSKQRIHLSFLCGLKVFRDINSPEEWHGLQIH